MPANPLRIIKQRLTAAIDWRAREAARVDEAVVAHLGSAIAEQGAELSRQVAQMRQAIEQLRGRVEELERTGVDQR